MYVDVDAEELLEQGDLCAGVPVALIGDTSEFVDTAKRDLIENVVPTAAMFKNFPQYGVLVRMAYAHVVVLSQSCDLEDVQKGKSGRVLIAHALPDSDPRVVSSYETAITDLSNALNKKIVAAVKSSTNADAAYDKAKVKFEQARDDALRAYWRGEVEGAIPLAAHEASKLERSICFFDNVVSLPATWIPFLKSQRVARLNEPWCAVLREKLSQWVGRFAFPGNTNERLRYGGLEVKAPTQPPKSEPTTRTSEPAKTESVGPKTESAKPPSEEIVSDKKKDTNE